MTYDEILDLEKQMWNAAQNRDSQAFLELVSENAVMVCGGYRCTGKEYAEIVSAFDCKSYEICGFEIVSECAEFIQVHYVIRLEVNNSENYDLAGKFHITTTWNKSAGKWIVVFNMDQRIIEQ